jgi:hypothetical protein
MKIKVLRWPYPYRWAFGFTSDTDNTSLEATRFFYDYCLEKGMYPTKTVWVHKPQRQSGVLDTLEIDSSPTLEDVDYQEYCQSISQKGIEFCLHDVSAGNNLREEIMQGFEEFQEAFGYYPRLHICHGLNQDHPYWSLNHFSHPLMKFVGKLIYGRRAKFSGEDPESPYYWSDICRRRIKYLRLYRALKFNVLKYNPSMPYHLYDKPDVRFWFSVSGGGHYLLNNLDHSHLDRLSQEDGAFILYGYEGELSEINDRGERRFKRDLKEAFEKIAARKDCWHAGVSSILDRCLAIKNLIVTTQKHAIVISNPTNIDLQGLQFSCDRPILWLSETEKILPDDQGVYQLEKLPSGSCISLFFSSQEGEVGDPIGSSGWETLRMLIEESKHILWKRFFRKRW